MTPMWTWGGIYFGYREGVELWTYDGKHIGRFQEDEVYSPNGSYLGEVMNGNRLIVSLQKSHKRSYSFAPYANRTPYIPYMNYIGYMMYVGYEDFPAPSAF